MTSAEIILGVVVLAELGVIYGLVNRLLSQAGQSRLHPAAAFEDASEVFRARQSSKDPVEHPKPEVVERIRIGV